MVGFSAETWALMAVFGVMAVVVYLQALASLIRDRTDLHDLRVRVHKLRRERLAAEAEAAEIAVVMEEPVEATRARSAA